MNSLGKLSETGLKVSDLGIFKTLGKVWKSLGFEQILSEISRKSLEKLSETVSKLSETSPKLSEKAYKLSEKVEKDFFPRLKHTNCQKRGYFCLDTTIGAF